MQQYQDGTLQEQPTTPFIGKIIEEELRRQERSVTWFSRKIHCARRNVYDIFRRSDIDTNLLLRISIVLRTDFFRYYSSAIQHAGYEIFTPEPIGGVRKQISHKRAIVKHNDNILQKTSYTNFAKSQTLILNKPSWQKNRQSQVSTSSP